MLFVGLAILIIFAIYKWNIPKKSSTPFPEPITLEPQKFAKSTSIPKAGNAVPKGEYTKVILDYQGRIIQFDEFCRAFPSKSVFKTGTKIMLDNRGSQEREVIIGTHHSIIPAYDFMTYILPSIETLSIDCGPLKNVATIISQP